MAKKFKRILSIVLTISMCMSMIGINAYADGTAESAPNVTVTGSGTAEDPTTTITTEVSTGTTPDGKPQITVDITAEWEGVTDTPESPAEPETPEEPAEDPEAPADPPAEPETPADPPQDPEPVPGTVTSVAGSSESTETTTKDGKNRPVHVEGSESGKESTITTKTAITKSESTTTSSVTTKGDTTTSESTQEVSRSEDSTSGAIDLDLEHGTDYGDVSVALKPGDTNKQGTGSAIDEGKYMNLPEVPEGAVALENGDGYTKTTTSKDPVTEAETKTTTTIVYTRDASGKIIGFKETEVVEVTEKPETGAPVESTPVVDAPVINPGKLIQDMKSTITLPEKPVAAADSTDSRGNVTSQTVEDIFAEDGVTVVGYKTTTTTKDKDGNVLNSESDSVWGRKVITTVNTTPTTTEVTSRQTVTTTTTTMITTGTTSSGTTVTATDRELIGSMSLVRAGSGHGVTDMRSTVTPGGITEPGVGQISTLTDLYHRADASGLTFDVNSDYIYQWLGEYGPESAIRVESDSVSSWQAHQFILRDKDGNAFYVYCADFEVSPQKGFGYGMENLEDATYYDDNDAKHIRAIATNGYWGSASGVGSLDQIKSSLKAAGQAVTGMTDDEIDSLTAGEALAGTQAALWKFGNSGDEGFDSSDIVGWYYKGGDSFNKSYSNAVVQKYYNYLIKLTADATSENTILTTNSITGSEITVGETIVDPVTGNKTYKTDVEFTLEVVPSADNSDLVVAVKDEAGNILTTKRLTGTNDGSEDFETITATGNTYKIEDLALPNGSKITLNLNGVQNLAEGGVYLYSSEVRDKTSSQTFVGLASGQRGVDLEVDLTFQVTDPTVTVSSSASGSSVRNKKTSVGVRIDTTVETTVDKDIETIEVTVDQNGREWYDTWENTYTYPGGKKPDEPKTTEPAITITTEPAIEIPEEPVPLSGDGGGDGGELEDLFDDEVPLAEAPETGDNAMVWYMMTLLSGLGLAIMALTGKRKEN